jgi:hypothetical protein
MTTETLSRFPNSRFPNLGFPNSWFPNSWFPNSWFPNSWFTNRWLTGPWWQRTRSFWQRLVRWGRRAPRSLRLRESLPLGEHRFVAVIEFEDSRLLIGGTPSSLVLLARLGSRPADPSAFAEADAARVPIEEFQTVRETGKGKQDSF